MSLAVYKKKRDFKKTLEPKGKREAKAGSQFVVQKHHASHLHYDFRLELDGVLKSWAVPKGPSPDPKQKRLAVQVEDHPVSYANFEGEIPAGEYGGGQVIVWDNGQWQPKSKSARADLKKGRLEFELFGEKLKGTWVLVRTRGAASKSWLLIKRTDDQAKSGPAADLIALEPASVISGRTIEDLERAASSPAKPAIKEPRAAPLKKSAPKKSVAKKKSKLKVADSALPKFVAPQLARLHEAPPKGDDWVHEIKYDGYRTLARLSDGDVTLLTRSGNDWTEKYGSLTSEFTKLKLESAILDGEIVCVNEKGRSDFHALQAALKQGETEKLLFYAFDLLFLNGEDLRERPLLERKAKLLKVIESSGRAPKIIFSEHWATSGQRLLEESCRLDLEGIISKRADAAYESGRGEAWVKSKCGHNEEFLIAGYTSAKGSRQGFGALVLGAYGDDGALEYVGRVGTGFGDQLLKSLFAQMKRLATKESPFATKVPQEAQVRWIKPSLVAQIKFAEFTPDHIIRHGSFVDLRDDKAPKDVKLRNAKTEEEKSRKLPPRKRGSLVASKSGDVAIGGVRISHASRVMFKSKGATSTKADLAEYYSAVAPRMLKFVGDRPLSLVRCPDGAEGKSFFQKHLVSAQGSEIHDFKMKLKERKEGAVDGVYVDSSHGLISLVQMGIVEIHNWGCRLDLIERPDSVVFDLDPDAKVGWTQVIDAAFAIREMMTHLKLKSFLKVTGGKGLHIHVPIERKYTWDQAKLFTKTVAAQLAKRDPRLYTTELMKKKRVGKIFIDYLRNGYGATAVSPFSVRARPGAPIALPIHWNQLTHDLDPAQFLMRDIKSILKSMKGDPWKDFSTSHRAISILKDAKMFKSP